MRCRLQQIKLVSTELDISDAPPRDKQETLTPADGLAGGQGAGTDLVGGEQVAGNNQSIDPSAAMMGLTGIMYRHNTPEQWSNGNNNKMCRWQIYFCFVSGEERTLTHQLAPIEFCSRSPHSKRGPVLLPLQTGDEPRPRLQLFSQSYT